MGWKVANPVDVAAAMENRRPSTSEVLVPNPVSVYVSIRMPTHACAHIKTHVLRQVQNEWKMPMDGYSMHETYEQLRHRAAQWINDGAAHCAQS